MERATAPISNFLTGVGSTGQVYYTTPGTNEDYMTQKPTTRSQLESSSLLTAASASLSTPSSNPTYLPNEDSSINRPTANPNTPPADTHAFTVDSSFQNEHRMSNMTVTKSKRTSGNQVSTVKSIPETIESTSGIKYQSTVTSNGRRGIGVSSSTASVSLRDAITTFITNDSTVIKNHTDDSMSFTNHTYFTQYLNTTPSVIDQSNYSMTFANHLNDSLTIGNHPDDSTVFINHKNDSTAFTNHPNASTAFTNHTDVSVTFKINPKDIPDVINQSNATSAITNHTDDNKSFSNHTVDSTTFYNHSDDSTTFSNHTEDNTTFSSHTDDSTTFSSYTDDSTTFSNHTDDSTTFSSHTDDSTTSSYHTDDSTTFPPHTPHDQSNLTYGITDDLVNNTKMATSTEHVTSTKGILSSRNLATNYTNGTPPDQLTEITTPLTTESAMNITSKQINLSAASLQVQFVIKFNKVFQPEYLDNTSLTYSNLKENITNQLTEQFKGVNHFKAIIIHGFSNGSVVVDYDLQLYAINQEGEIINATQLKEDLTKVKGQLVSLPDINKTYLDVHYDAYVSKGVELAESAAQDRCQFQDVCSDPLYACDSQMGACVLICRQRDTYQRLPSSSDVTYVGACKCLGQGTSGKLVSSEVDCWVDHPTHVVRRIRQTEIIALSVSLSLAVLMIAIIAAVWVTVPNKHTKVATAATVVDMSEETKDTTDSLDYLTKGESNSRNSQKLLQLKQINFESGWDTDDQQTTSDLGDAVQDDGLSSSDTELQQDVTDHHYYSCSPERDVADLDWRDLALETIHVQLPRLLMSDE
ncbi:hypothetical protein Btru_006499 [Bulinus truncatus]|nr:hypothetical protein Btru_006499 [Bulinus truncatus]